MDGEIVRITNHGVVVKLQDSDTNGFVHLSELREGTYVEHPAEEFEEGEQVRVRVLKLTPDFLGLTMKNLGRKTIDDFTTGQDVTGRVTKVTNFGAFVDIGADKDCLLHKSQILDGKYVGDAREVLQEGDEVTARILKKDEAKGRMELSRRPQLDVLRPLQRGQKLASLRPGQEMGGVVTSVKTFGCFVDVGAEADGLLHVRNINDGVVANIDDLLKFGDPVVVRVLGQKEGKLELELASPLPRLPEVGGFKKVAPYEWLEGELVGMAPFGAFVALDQPGGGPKVTAELGLSKMKDADTLSIGDKVKVRLLRVDTERKRVFVSMKYNATDTETSE